jgi:hypothetical protein
MEFLRHAHPPTLMHSSKGLAARIFIPEATDDPFARETSSLPHDLNLDGGRRDASADCLPGLSTRAIGYFRA